MVIQCDDRVRRERLEELIPNLKSAQYELTSCPDDKYNCIAWAAGDATWPEGANLREALQRIYDLQRISKSCNAILFRAVRHVSLRRRLGPNRPVLGFIRAHAVGREGLFHRTRPCWAIG